MAIFTIVQASDWMGLYINGSLAEEGHNIGASKALDWAKSHGPVTKLEHYSADDEWLEDIGNLPGQLRQVRFDPEEHGQ